MNGQVKIARLILIMYYIYFVVKFERLLQGFGKNDVSCWEVLPYSW